MRLEPELSPDHADAYTDAKRLPRRIAPNVFGMSIDIIVISNDGIVFREYRTNLKETAVGKAKIDLLVNTTPLVVVITL
jgi:hypothetical protein